MGNPNAVGSHHGANGAQFKGRETQFHHQNQLHNHVTISSIQAEISSTDWFMLDKAPNNHPQSSLL
jgi:hypothetical protein